ncbi:MAG: ankyrin repeat domain-containing protein [Fuerstiella sp.]
MANHPIFAPTFHGDVDCVKRQLEADPTVVHVRNAKNLTALHVAASRNQCSVAELLIAHGADIHGHDIHDTVDGNTADGNTVDSSEWTPLVFAAYRGHREVAEVLIQHGASVTAASGNPLHFAGQRKHKEICQLLVKHGAVDDLIESADADILKLFRAAYSYDSNSVDQLLNGRPELVHCKDRKGRTLLHETCTQGDTKTVRILLKHAADVTIKDSRGETAADRAAAHNQRAVMRILDQHEPSA